MFSYTEVKKKSGKKNIIPLVKELLADTETPVSVFCKIYPGSLNAFLLESVEGKEITGRYSFIGVDSFLTIRSTQNRIQISGIENRNFTGDPIKTLRQYLKAHRPLKLKGLPPFTGGAVGYFGYDTIRLIEKIPETVKDDLHVPEMNFSFYDTVIVFDNKLHKLFIISNIIIKDKKRIKKAYDKAVFKIESIVNKLTGSYIKPFKKATKLSKPKSNFKRSDFYKAVNKIKKYINEGDIFQAVLSQRFEITTDAEPLDIYRMLRILNPSPYNFFIKMDDIFLIGSSPELLVRVTGKDIITRPLAGTRKRGKDEKSDRDLELELINDPKERAEHIMLVDLGRNDLGRISEYGTVNVESLMDVEKYSHVMHISSSVTGKLRSGKDRIDALYSCMPAGTLSGAPKIRAMEIIDELEPTKRLTYGGAIGYLDFSGNLDSCIAIRTILMKSNKVYIQAGAGIVADSIAENEYEETQNKAMALFKALKSVKEFRG